MTNLSVLRLVGWIEAVSFLLLLGIAMPMKYSAGDPRLVQLIGPIHGLLFMVFIAQVVYCYVEQKIDGKLTLACAIGAFLPFGPMLYHRRLGELATAPPEADATADTTDGATADDGPGESPAKTA